MDSTGHQPLIEMAEEAARMAVRLFEGERPNNLRLDLATSPVVRQRTPLRAVPGTRWEQ